MNIIVCMKYISSIKDYTELRLPFSPNDCNALAMALDLKNKNSSSKIIVVSMGPTKAMKTIKDLYSYGVDSVNLISDKAYAGSDTLATTLILSTAIKKIINSEKIDLVLCGDKSIDSNTGQVVAGLAYRLNAKYFGDLRDVVLEKGKFEFINTEYILKCYSGLVVADVKSEKELPFPALNNIISCREKDVICWSNSDLGVDLTKVGLKGSPTAIIKAEEINTKIDSNFILEDSEETRILLRNMIVEEEGKGGVYEQDMGVL